MRAAALIIALAVALTVMAGEPDPVVLRVRPHVMLPGAALFVEAVIQPHADNRWLLLEATPDLAVSESSLEGLRGLKRFSRQWIAGEPGEYLIRASVLDGRRQLRAYAQQRIVIAE